MKYDNNKRQWFAVVIEQSAGRTQWTLGANGDCGLFSALFLRFGSSERLTQTSVLLDFFKVLIIDELE